MMNPKVDLYFMNADKWQDEMEALRTILLDCGLNEELKWSKPCYSFENKNIVVIQGFKKYCALLFFKGYLLKDAKGILIKTGENTRVGRQVRFTGVPQVMEMQNDLKTYIHEAIDIERSGLKENYKEKAGLVFPEELQNKFEEMPALKTSFNLLTPGRQRAYIIYFSSARQPGTRKSRIEKCMPQILNGKGLNDY